MLDSVFDLIRSVSEEVERLEQFAVDELLKRPRTHREKIAQEILVCKLLDRITKQSTTLDKLLIKDEDGMKKREFQDLAGDGAELSEFYRRLKEVKEYHRRNPNELIESLDRELKSLRTPNLEELDSLFSGEEGFGKYLDLHELHEQFINLKGETQKVEYMAYLDQFFYTHLLSKELKSRPEYLQYIKNLRAYLEDFLKRSRPLLNMKELGEKTLEEFELAWSQNLFPGWQEDSFDDSSALKSLFCIACEKQFSKQSVFDSHLNGKKHLKAAEALKRSGKTKVSSKDVETLIQSRNNERKLQDKRVALEEAFVMKLGNELMQVIEDTKSYVERKQSRTVEEREEDVYEEEDIELEDEDEVVEDEEFKLYNPLKVPLGWDGKPIPFWLFKLHGLGVEYPCEICGNYVYMGRKAFERHFSEWRHSHALKCLGITNSKHFYEITNIEDAISLWERLKVKAKTEFFQPDTMEEYEDDDGNVYNKKTFEDLKRQGIL